MRNEAGKRLIEFRQENALVIANTLFQQHKRRLYTWTSLDGQYRNQTDYIFASKDEEPLFNSVQLLSCVQVFATKDGEALYSQQKQGQGLTVAQIMNSLLTNSDLN